MNQIVEKYFRKDKLPHIWCPGCGHGIVLHQIAKAIDSLGLDKDNVCVVSGIGCSSRGPGYLDFDTLHTTHGRALAFATGIKLANPEMKVIIISGDGDASAIGGNHLIHACRRNIDITTIVFNNNIYGMTGGQYSPTTPCQDYGSTAPYGNIDRPFDIAKLAASAGATYSARSTVSHTKELQRYIEEGIENEGFSVVEAMTMCPTSYGRKNKKGSPAQMMNLYKENYLDINVFDKLPREKTEGKFEKGVFKNEEAPEYTKEYQKVIDSLRGDNNE